MEKSTILIVDDETGIRELIRMYLEKEGYEVLEAENGEQGIELATSLHPQLILLDIEMPNMTGFEVCRRIRQEMTVPIIFLSVRRGVMDKLKCFELGGDDYVEKPFDYAELEARIRVNLRRYNTEVDTSEGNILQYDELKINLESYECYVDDQLIDLTPKEIQLLIELATRPNQMLSAEQLYDKVWGFESYGDLQTVKVHISNIRRKLEKDPANPKFILTTRGLGYLFRDSKTVTNKN